jgi:indolepyruvate ferredoxin oxidoreductase
LLAKLKFLRGTCFDPFGLSAERQMERQLVAEYRELVLGLLPSLNEENHTGLVKLFSLAQQIRGFGHVKQAAVDNYRRQLAHMLQDKDTAQHMPLAA